jgi:hypothetical protein
MEFIKAIEPLYTRKDIETNESKTTILENHHKSNKLNMYFIVQELESTLTNLMLKIMA